MLGGIAVPAALPLALWYTGEPGSSQRVAAAAAGQAAALGLATSAVVKAFTGRVSPEAPEPADLTARSKAFRFGFLRGGILEGWPSGHTTTNVAMATALATSDSWAVRAGAGAFALWVALSVSFGINGEVHWTSDAVAGLLTGAVVGWTVDRSFRPGSSGALAGPSPGSTVRIHSLFPVFSGEF